MKFVPRRPPAWQVRPPMPQRPFQPWLIDRGSLTRRIRHRCDRFDVRGLRQAWGKAWHDEIPLLGLRRDESVLVREVYLYCGERPVVFARSVLARAGLRGPWQSLDGLGNRPLGAALFANPRVRRMPLQFRKLNPRQALYRRAAEALLARPSQLWARRSVFTLGGRPLLVTEVFLPDILELRP